MRIRTACIDHELLWVIDDVIGGLYSIDRRTFETKCRIDCMELFPNQRFEVRSLIKWKEEYIIIIPQELDKNWIFYNKITGEIEYRKIIEQKYLASLIIVAQDRNQLYLFTMYIDDPIIIVNLDTLTCVGVIEDRDISMPHGHFQVAWTGTYNGKHIFSPQEHTRVLMRLDCETPKIHLMELSIRENIICVDYAFGELWVLPANGNKLYQIDENGQIVNIIELCIENTVDTIPEFIRIVVHKRYLFLLPRYRKGIYVYDKLEGKTYIIPKENQNLQQVSRENSIRYWEYCIGDNQICVLPYIEQYIEIDLDTLKYKIEKIDYPKTWSDKEKVCIWSHIFEKNLTTDESEICNLNVFLSYLKYKKNRKDFLENRSAGKSIWDVLTPEKK